MKIIGKKILIQPSAPIDKLPSGIYLSPSAAQKPNTGTIVVVGSRANKTLQSQLVMYNPIVAVTINGYHLIHVTDIRLIL